VLPRMPGTILSEDDRDILLAKIGELPCCATCRFWNPPDVPGWSTDPPSIPDGPLPVGFLHWTGDCVRRSPSIMRNKADREVGVFWQFPGTEYQLWCGDYQRETDSDCADRAVRDSLEFGEPISRSEVKDR
jgi:hypothetical protein